jgi:ABC-type antimicrobial peptide transport system permease subunit
MTAIPPFAVGIIATVLSALFPAVQTSRLRVVDALRVD